MLACLLSLGLVTLLPGLEARVSQYQLQGLPRQLHAADVDADGIRDALIVLDRDNARYIAVIDGTSVDDGLGAANLRVIPLPDDTVFVTVCPRVGPGLIMVRDHALWRLDLEAKRTRIAAIPDALPFIERGDVAVLELCDDNGELSIPTLGGVTVLGKANSIRNLQVPTRAYLTPGHVYRGPRARRDFSLMTMLVHPRIFAGDVDGDGSRDLVASVEDELGIYLGNGSHAELSLMPHHGDNVDNSSVDTEVVELTGDGILDAIVTEVRGGSGDMRTRWAVYAGPLLREALKPMHVVERKGLAAPLLLSKLKADGPTVIVEPLVDTSVIAMGRALVTGSVPVAYRVYQYRDGAFHSSKPIDINHDIDFGRSTNLSGHPPLLEADINGDGRNDMLALGAANRVDVYLGNNGDPPYSTRSVLDVSVPDTRWAVSLRHDSSGPAMVLLLDEHRGSTRLTAVRFTNDTPR